MKLPLIRSLVVAPARAPILRYGVALLSAMLALIPALFFSDIAESRLVVFAVAVMVSAWPPLPLRSPSAPTIRSLEKRPLANITKRLHTSDSLSPSLS